MGSTTRRQLWLFLFAAAAIFLGTRTRVVSARAVEVADKQEAPRPGYLGDQACATCHAAQAQSYPLTAHHRSARLAGPGWVPGASFVPGKNVLLIQQADPLQGKPGFSYKMEKKDGAYTITAITTLDAGLETTRTETIDVVIGSGHRGQSFLDWRGSALFELPVSSWTEGRQWINSPGYQNGPAYFDRPATARCLECHLGFAQALSSDALDNHFDKRSLEPAIACETCHGPGAKHAALHSPGSAMHSASDEEILNPAHFSRDRQLDLCALCHNGAQQSSGPRAFAYVPGQPLDDYLKKQPLDPSAPLDVHANQVGLLEKSRCLLASPAMNCSTCHDVHAAEKEPADYAERCLRCHRVEACGMEKKLGPSIRTQCIGCHMPVLPTNAITSVTGDTVIRTSMRTHWIKVYDR